MTSFKNLDYPGPIWGVREPYPFHGPGMYNSSISIIYEFYWFKAYEEKVFFN